MNFLVFISFLGDRACIVFEPEDPKVGRPEGASIKEGAYSVPIAPAKYKVRITANKEGKFDKVVNAKTYEQYLPKKFNTHTTLSADVTATGSTQFDFDLKK